MSEKREKNEVCLFWDVNNKSASDNFVVKNNEESYFFKR